jgi:tight adherence protein C
MIWLIAAATGLCTATVVAWVVGRLAFVPAATAPLAAHPSLAHRMAGRLIALVARYSSPWLSPRGRRAIERRLTHAGMRYVVDAIHFHAAQCLCAGMLATTATAITALLLPAAPIATMIGLGMAGCALGAAMPRIWLRDRAKDRKRRIVRALPFMLDMTTLCVEAGLNLASALQQAAQKGPDGPLRDELRRLQGDIRTGMSRSQALRDMADRLDEPAVRTLVATLVQADALGMNLAPILRAQSDQRRTERFLHAEKLAMEAPVKMLLPLIAFIFPCTFMVIAFPIAVKLFEFSW